ncbi:MAG: hypothetical protein WB780_17545 [Candidatus Acidiferrales bacterium]
MSCLDYVGTIGVHRTFSEGTPVFDVFFAPKVDDSACNSRRFRALEELAEFLEFLDVREEMVERTLDEVRAGRSALIPNVTLSDEVISHQGLDSTITMKRRIN